VLGSDVELEALRMVANRGEELTRHNESRPSTACKDCPRNSRRGRCSRTSPPCRSSEPSIGAASGTWPGIPAAGSRPTNSLSWWRWSRSRRSGDGSSPWLEPDGPARSWTHGGCSDPRRRPEWRAIRCQRRISDAVHRQLLADAWAAAIAAEDDESARFRLRLARTREGAMGTQRSGLGRPAPGKINTSVSHLPGPASPTL
jgi:hypothetical protein